MYSLQPHNAVLCAIINWNGWKDTVSCVASFFQLSHQPDHLVICDNNSSDNSVQAIYDWITENYHTTDNSITIAPGGGSIISISGHFSKRIDTVYIFRLPQNFGYAGAINRCIKWGQESLSARNFWLLNNDVKFDPDAFGSLLQASNAYSDVGLCGSILLDWEQPESIQAIGGIFNRWIGTARHLKNIPDPQKYSESIFFGIDYPVGASLFVTEQYLKTVGLMDEGYFLYYEEMDWAERGRRHGFRPAVALRSLVQHKEGASTGSRGSVRNKSLLSEHYGVINRLRITQKFWPRHFPVVWGSLWLVILDRLIHGEWTRARLVLRLMFSPQYWILKKRA